jgi:hypothetical protein
LSCVHPRPAGLRPRSKARSAVARTGTRHPPHNPAGKPAIRTGRASPPYGLGGQARLTAGGHRPGTCATRTRHAAGGQARLTAGGQIVESVLPTTGPSVTPAFICVYRRPDRSRPDLARRPPGKCCSYRSGYASCARPYNRLLAAEYGITELVGWGEGPRPERSCLSGRSRLGRRRPATTGGG